MKKTKRIISIILSVFMLISLMPQITFAAAQPGKDTLTVKKVYWEDWAEDVIQCTFNNASGYEEGTYMYAYCIGAAWNGKVALYEGMISTDGDVLSWTHHLEEELRQPYYIEWKEELQIPNAKPYFGFAVVDADDCSLLTDIVVVDATGKTVSLDAGFVEKCSETAYAYCDTEELIFSGTGVIDSYYPQYDEHIKNIVFESGITGAADDFITSGYPDFPRLRNVFAYNPQFDLTSDNEFYLYNDNTLINIYAKKNSPIYNRILNADKFSDIGYNLMDIDKFDEDYRTSVEHVDEVKIMSDLGMIPNLYEVAEMPVSKIGFAKSMVFWTNADMSFSSLNNFADMTDGTGAAKCANKAVERGWVSPKSDTEFAPDDTVTYGSIKSVIINELFYITDEKREALSTLSFLEGVEENDTITYEQLAVLYHRIFMEIGYCEELDATSYSLFQGSVSTWLGDDNCWHASLEGKVTDNGSWVSYTNEDLIVSDVDLYGVNDDDVTLIMGGNRDTGIYSTYDISTDGKTYRADFTINNGAAETDNQKVSIKLSAEGYTKYKIGNGNYKSISPSAISHTLDEAHGEKSVSITFVNDDQSRKKTITKTIMLNNLRKIVYMVDGVEFASQEVGCGLEIPQLTSTPVKEGYAFDGWETVPDIMPNKNVTVTAKFVVAPPIASGAFANQNATWSISQDGTLYISGTGAADFERDNETQAVSAEPEYLSNSEYREFIKNVVVGEGITALGDGVVYEIYNAENITLPSTLTKIGKGFAKGSCVKTVTIPAGVVDFDLDMAFAKCEAIESVYFMNKDIQLVLKTEYDYLKYASTDIRMYGYSDSNVDKYAELNDCSFVSMDPDFTINDGARETESKDVKIKFNDYAKKDFKQYKLNDGQYKNIKSDTIDYALDAADGQKEIKITFKNDIYEIEKSQTITFNNKHKVAYMFNDEQLGEAVVGCGATVAQITQAPAKDGYKFIKWDTPAIMPDEDIVVGPIFVKELDGEVLNSLLTEEEIADGITAKAEVAPAVENETIAAEIVNKYSTNYTASIIVNIDIAKGKDDEFTPITETSELLAFELDIPKDIQGRKEYIIVREHNGVADALTTAKNGDGEYIKVDGNKITIYAKKFSAYMLIAKVPSTPSRTGGGGGGGGVASYSVTAQTSENGTVSFSPKGAAKGKEVTITVTPDEGYKLDKITVLDKDNNEIEVKEADGKYTFVMPASKVTVSATFAEEKKEEDAQQPQTDEKSAFGDVASNSYYYDAVLWAVENAITSGTSGNTFSPDDACTRAQIVTFLYRAAGSPDVNGTGKFDDVSAGSYYEKAVLWAVENGITSGTADNAFSPDMTCTRAQAVTFISRALKGSATGSVSFADVASDSYYANAVLWAVENGITNGTSDTTFAPDENCTRAQIVTFLYRAMADK